MASQDPARNALEALSGTDAQVVATLVENHRRFLGFLEKRLGSRELAEEVG